MKNLRQVIIRKYIIRFRSDYLNHLSKDKPYSITCGIKLNMNYILLFVWCALLMVGDVTEIFSAGFQDRCSRSHHFLCLERLMCYFIYYLHLQKIIIYTITSMGAKNLVNISTLFSLNTLWIINADNLIPLIKSLL